MTIGKSKVKGQRVLLTSTFSIQIFDPSLRIDWGGQNNHQFDERQLRDLGTRPEFPKSLRIRYLPTIVLQQNCLQ